jgi:hypothetical protein
LNTKQGDGLANIKSACVTGSSPVWGATLKKPAPAGFFSSIQFLKQLKLNTKQGDGLASIKSIADFLVKKM